MAKRLEEAIEGLGGHVEQQNALLGRVEEHLRPPPRMPSVGSRSDLTPRDGDFLVRNIPALQLAFQRAVPDKHVELEPGLARIHCPCGAVNELMPANLRACIGPEGGECPRFYLFTGTSVRVANADMLAAG